MEPLFENKYNRTKEDYKEFYISNFFKRPIFLLLIVLIVALIVRATLFENIIYAYSAWFLVLYTALMSAYILFFRPNLSYKREMELNGGKPLEITYVVTEEKIIVDSSNNTHLELNYFTIKKVRTTKSLILLMTKTRLFYILRKDSFTKGTPDEFIAFINSKINSNR